VDTNVKFRKKTFQNSYRNVLQIIVAADHSNTGSAKTLSEVK
jgi:septum formation topological specificity factor MinE